MKTKTLLRYIIVSLVLITFSATSAKAFTPYTWDVSTGNTASLTKFAQNEFQNSYDGTNYQFGMWNARYLFLKRGVADAYWFSGDFYQECTVESSNPGWGANTLDGNINMYISMDNSAVSNDYTSESANFTVVQLTPKTGRVVLLQKANNVTLFSETVELGRDMTGRKTIKVYNQAGIIDVYIYNNDGSVILHPFNAKALVVPAGEIGISSGYGGFQKVLSLNIKNIVDAPAKPADAVSVASVSLDKTTATINLVETLKLTPTVLPSDASDKSVNWTSSNTNVATVDGSGNVNPLIAGQSTITATTLDGAKTASCVVTVIAVPAGDVSTFTVPALTTTIYENDFSDANSATSQLWQLVAPATINDNVLGGASNWQTAPVNLTGNYQLKITLKMEEAAWHTSSIRFNIDNSSANYYEINTQMTGVNIKKVTDGVSADLVNLTGEKFRPNYTYTINQFGNNLEIYRDIPQGERKNLVAITDNSIVNGSFKFKSSDQWSHKIDYFKMTTLSAVAQIVNVSGTVNASDLMGTNAEVSVLDNGVLSVNASKTVKTLDLTPGSKVIISGSNILTVTGDVILEADKDINSFNLNLGSGGMAVTGTVRYVKTIDDTKWYFLSFPCNVPISGITKKDGSAIGNYGTNWFIKYYDGSQRIQNLGTSSNWVSMTVGQILTAYKGYIFAIANGTGPIDVSFPLDKTIVQSENARPIPVTAHGVGLSNNQNNLGQVVGENHKGWNLIGQPYLSKFAGGDGTINNTGATYMVFSNGANTTTYTQLASKDVTNINPFSAFFVQAATTGDINFNLVGRKNAPSLVSTSTSDEVQLTITTSTGVDNANLIMDNDQSPEYQIGQDLEKWLGTGSPKPQIYSTLNNINYAFNALPIENVVNLALGIYCQTAENTTIGISKKNAPSLSKLLLKDKSNGNETDLLTSNYSFNSTAGIDNNRFVITAQRIPTYNKVENDGNEPILITNNGKLFINNLLTDSNIRVYDVVGKLIAKETATSNKIQIALTKSEIYIVQIKSGEKTITRKLINQ